MTTHIFLAPARITSFSASLYHPSSQVTPSSFLIIIIIIMLVIIIDHDDDQNVFAGSLTAVQHRGQSPAQALLDPQRQLGLQWRAVPGGKCGFWIVVF